jgi:hypothetical protein
MLLRRKLYPECSEGVGRDLKGTLVYPIEESPENPSPALRPVAINGIQALGTRAGFIPIVVEYDSCCGLILQKFSQN